MIEDCQIKDTKQMFIPLLLLFTSVHSVTVNVDVPYFICASLDDDILFVAVGFDTRNHTNISVTFASAPPGKCSFLALQSEVFIANDTWIDCLPPLTSSGNGYVSTSNIDVSSLWSIDGTVVPTFFTLTLSISFETSTALQMSSTTLTSTSAEIQAYKYEPATGGGASTPVAARQTATQARSGSGGSCVNIGAVIGAIVGAAVLFVSLAAVTYVRYNRNHVVVPV
jgi:hypothetical protein